jgi:hypothetical protein
MNLNGQMKKSSGNSESMNKMGFSDATKYKVDFKEDG